MYERNVFRFYRVIEKNVILLENFLRIGWIGI